jgi:membrane protease YdiL (CAAX protease family)
MIGVLSGRRPWPTAGRPVGLAGGLAVAVVARAALNGSAGPSAFLAGTVFGLGLIGLAVRAGWRARRPGIGVVGLGIAGGLALVILPAIARPGVGPAIGIHPEPFVAWAAVTMLVAVGEEATLRGALFDSLRATIGVPATVAITSMVFALVHVPLYGWHVVPLDLAVGFWLAGLRLLSRGVAAPAIAHALADLATWWL